MGTTITIDKEFQTLIPPLTDDEYRLLEESILAEGCRDALITWHGILIDGHNRYKICEKYGLPYDTTETDFESRDSVIEWIIKNQFGRRNLPLYERARLALRLKPVIAERAEIRMKNPMQNSAQGTTRDELAKAAGVSHDTIAKVEKIEASASEETKAALRSGEISINRAFTEIKRQEKAEQREEQRQTNAKKVETLSTPLEAAGLFQTIVIDPPWDWGDEGDVNQFGRAKPDYTTMPIEDIERLPIGRISDENCHLYLWVTNRSLPKAFRLIEAWGFRYITCLTWVKPSIGMGNYFRGSTEQVLFCVKGSQPLKRHDVGTHFTAPRGDRHSSKPEEFYKLVESCSYAPYIDVFGRNGREGWSVWGENG